MEDEVKFTFDLNFQIKLLKLILEDPIVLIKSITYVKPNYFETKWLSWFFTKTIGYYNKYQKIITKAVFLEEIKGLNDSEPLLEYLEVVNRVYAVKVEEPEYIITKLEEFIKRNIFISGMKSAASLYNNNKFDEAMLKTEKFWNEVTQVKFDDADRTFFFNDIETRLARRNAKLERSDNKYTTGVFELDRILHGGLEKGELGIIVADAKVGKSVGLINVGATNVLAKTPNVVHFNCEGKDGQSEDRYESRILNMDYNKIKYNEVPTDAYEFYKQSTNNLVICNLTKRWNYTVLDIENQLIELRTYRFTPDIVIVDYGDLLSPREASKDNSYQAQQEVFRDLKTLAIKYNVVVWTASQVARPPLGANPNSDANFLWTRRNLADCYAKVRIADLLITLNMTDEEKLNRRLRIYVDAYRDSECGQKITITTNYANMQFYVPSLVSYERALG